jgi:predicted transcriptional regulator
MQSIQPFWTQKIKAGIKTRELRKSKPKNIHYPFTVFMYETKQGAGAVVGEYTCRCIIRTNLDVAAEPGSCVPLRRISEYRKGGFIFGWDISNVIFYDTPKPLSDFGLSRAPQSWCYVNNAAQSRAEIKAGTIGQSYGCQFDE